MTTSIPIINLNSQGTYSYQSITNRGHVAFIKEHITNEPTTDGVGAIQFTVEYTYLYNDNYTIANKKQAVIDTLNSSYYKDITPVQCVDNDFMDTFFKYLWGLMVSDHDDCVFTEFDYALYYPAGTVLIGESKYPISTLNIYSNIDVYAIKNTLIKECGTVESDHNSHMQNTDKT